MSLPSIHNKAIHNKIRVGNSIDDLSHPHLKRELDKIKEPEHIEHVFKVIIATQSILTINSEITSEQIKHLEKYIEDNVFVLNKYDRSIKEPVIITDHFIQFIIKIACHKKTKFSFFRSHLTDEIKKVLNYLNISEEKIKSTYEIYSHVEKSFHAATEIDHLGNFHNTDLALELIRIFTPQYVEKILVISAFERATEITPQNDKLRNREFALSLIKLCGHKYIGENSIRKAYLNAIELRGIHGNGDINTDVFSSLLLQKCGYLFLGKNCIQTHFIQVTIPIPGVRSVCNAQTAETLLKICGAEFIGSKNINQAFSIAIKLFDRNRLTSDFLALILIKFAVCYITNEQLIRAYSLACCPMAVLEAIAGYVRSHPERNITLPYREDIDGPIVAHNLPVTEAFEIHNYASDEVSLAISELREMCFNSYIPSRRFDFDCIKNKEELIELIEELFSQKQANQAKETLRKIFTSKYYGKKLEEAIAPISGFVMQCKFGLKSHFRTSTSLERVKIWLESALIESSEAYSAGDMMSCHKGIYERFITSGLRGIWDTVDAFFLPSEFFRLMPDGVSDSKCDLFLSDIFLEKLATIIKTESSSSVINRKDDDLKVDERTVIKLGKFSLQEELFAKYCSICFENHLYEQFKVALLPHFLFFKESDLEKMSNLYDEIIKSKFSLIKNFSQHAHLIPNLIEKLNGNIST